MMKFVYIFMAIVILKLATGMPEFDESEEKSLKLKVDELQKFINQELERLSSNDFRDKRGSDIEERLMELQSKLKDHRENSKNMIGHGRFDFDDLGKRSGAKNNFLRILLKSREKK